MVGTLTNQIPASSAHKARKVHMACKVPMAHKARKACKAHMVHKVCKACKARMARKACKVVGRISGFYVNEVFHFH